MKLFRSLALVISLLIVCSTIGYSAPVYSAPLKPMINAALRSVSLSITGWQPVTKYAIPGTNVLALAVDPSNRVYAGGILNWPNSPNIFSWSSTNPNPDVWMTMGAGLNGPVKSMALASNKLYAAGDFPSSGSIATNHVAVWSGSSWSGMGSGVNQVSAIATDSNANVYVAEKNSAQGAASYIRKWNATTNSWNIIQSFNGPVYSLTFDPASQTLYAGGSFTSINLIAAPTAAKNLVAYDVRNNSWSTIMGTNYNPITAIAINNGVIYIGGNFTAIIKKEPGANWTAIGGTFDGFVSALAVDGTNHVYAGGTFTKYYKSGASFPLNHVAIWDGSSWIQLGNGLNGNVNALAFDSAGTLYAGGNFSKSGTVTLPRVAKYIF